MTKILHLIRHGESEANKLGIYQGQSHDTDLTGKGVKQAKLAANLFKKVKADKIFTSPLKRAYQTALEIKKTTSLELTADKLLLEINHGSWEGKKADEFDNNEQIKLRRWMSNPVGIKMPEGEDIQAVVKRCNQFIKELESGVYIVVTHDFVIRVMAAMVIKHEFKYLWKYHLDNGGVTTISFDPLRLVSLNQNFHLNGNRSLLNRQAL